MRRLGGSRCGSYAEARTSQPPDQHKRPRAGLRLASHSLPSRWQFPFVYKVKSELEFKAMHREVAEVAGTYTLRERSEAYAGDFDSENDALTENNTILRQKNAETTEIWRGPTRRLLK